LPLACPQRNIFEERTESLLQRLHWISDHIDELDGVNLENGKLHIDRLEKDAPDESRNFSLSLYELLPRIKLTERLETKQSPKDAAFALLGLSLLSF
jgi:hypothetical protein